MSQRLVSGAGQSSSPELGDGDRLTLLPTWVLNPPIILEAAKTARLPFRSRSRFRAGPVRKLRRRAVLKSGECNVLQSRISRRSLRFLQDIFTTLVDTQWRWTLLCFALSFLLSWLAFAGIWWLIAFTHGDFEPRHQTDAWRPCVNELHGFTSCFLFSIETQHTIGYGGRSTTEECPEAIFVMCIQSISGVMIQAFMVGIVFAKMSRPKQRTQTLLFSRQAVICQRDGELCIMFRVGDMRKSHIIGAHVRAQLIKSRTTKEGEVLHHNQQELAVGADGQPESLFFIWPCTVVHRINAQSPFYCMSAEDMLAERFELVVILEGTIESTGQTTQARSSYLPQEILWGHRFEPMVSYSKERQGYEVDYSLFDSTVQVDTPLCSGRELSEFYRLQDELRQPAFSGAQLTTPQEEFTTSFWRRYPQLSPTVPSARYGCYCPECKEECHWRTLDVSRCVLCHEFEEKLCSCPLDDYRRYLFPAMGYAARNNSPLEQHPNRNPWMLSSCYNSSSEDETAMSPARSGTGDRRSTSDAFDCSAIQESYYLLPSFSAHTSTDIEYTLG